jgi:NAD(P)-dependent dehydrogenase (short-subunit alcohol dehydrogenase family)
MELIDLHTTPPNLQTFNEPKWEDEIKMYTICSIAPVFLIRHLSSSLAPSAKIIILTSEGGSLTLRTEKEGGGMFGHHGSKAAANMVGRLLSFDLKGRGIAVAMIHVSVSEACRVRL